MKKKLLSQEALKLIACLTMLIDHFGYAIVPHLQIPNTGEVVFICRVIGRLAFPIFCFLLVEGMRHTRNPKKYILRLFIGMLLAEVPFDMIYTGNVSWAHQSVMVTLTLGAMMLLCMEKTEQEWLKLLTVLFFALLAEAFHSNYGAGGVILIAVFAMFDHLLLQTVTMLLLNWQLIPSAIARVFDTEIKIQLLATFAIIPIALYSGKKLTHSKAIQWGFYLFYPAHLLVLWIILTFIR